MTAESTPPFVPDFDPRSAYPTVAAVSAAAHAADWPRLLQACQSAPTWDDLLLGMDQVSGPDCEGFLQSIMADQPNPVAATFLGSAVIMDAWRIRGSGWGRTVGPEQARQFLDRLNQADQVLSWACAVDPGYLPAWAHRLTTSKGLSLGQAESRRRYDHIAQIDPHNYYAQTSMLSILCAKWGGDNQTMHQFAIACAEAAPVGSVNPTLVVLAHWEIVLEMTRNSEMSARDATVAHFNRHDVRAQIQWAAHKSVLSSAFTRRAHWVSAMSAFGLALALCGDWSASKYCFLQLGPYANSSSWNYLSPNPQAGFLANRAQALELG
ncbi:MAG: hypothetical protein FWD75_00435 [Propionibacteriaceae bacterium]|nr:hypothetical protein [Propionibacteriaceae bacterium]